MSMTSRDGCHCQGGGQTWTRSLWMNSPQTAFTIQTRKTNNPSGGKLNIITCRLGLVFYSTTLVMHILATALLLIKVILEYVTDRYTNPLTL
jgi:hypothetical protein